MFGKEQNLLEFNRRSVDSVDLKFDRRVNAISSSTSHDGISFSHTKKALDQLTHEGVSYSRKKQSSKFYGEEKNTRKNKGAIPILSLFWYRLLIFIFLIFSSTLWGVAKDDANSTEVKTSSNDVTSEVAVREIIPVDQEYHYSSMSKPNPFVPPLMSAFLAKETVPVENSLQKFPLQVLTVVGIWSLKNGIRKALVITPESEGIVTAIGKNIGRRGGKVVAIRDDSILVREFSLASDGSRQYEEITLWLEGKKEEPEEKEFEIRANSIMHKRDKTPYSVDKSEDVDLVQRVKVPEDPTKSIPNDNQKPVVPDTKSTEGMKPDVAPQNSPSQATPQNQSSTKLGQ